MRWQFSLKTEILQRAHDAASEERFPLTVDRHAGGEWIFLRYQPFRKRETVRRRVGRQWRQERRHARRHFLLRLKEFAAVMTECVSRMIGRALAHRQCRGKY